MNTSTVTTGEVRLSYTNLFQAVARQQGAEAKYSTTVLVPKSDFATKTAIDAAIAAAIDAGVSKCWNGVRPPQPAICVHDGDGARPSDGQAFGAECRGHWVFTASSKNAPFVVDQNVQPILQQSEIYSGMYGRVSVNFFAYSNSGKKGIGCGLNGVQKTRDGEPLASHVSAAEAFGAPAAPVYPQQPSYPQQAAPQYPPQYAPAPPYGYPTAAPVQSAYPQPAAPAYPQPSNINPFTGMPIMGM